MIKKLKLMGFLLMLSLMSYIMVNAQATSDWETDYKKGMKAFENENYPEAMASFLKAAEKGDLNSRNNIGYMYQYGLGVNQDFEKAIFWYLGAANQGDVNAQTNLGYMYEIGDGVNRNESMAIAWYKMAAEQNDVIGQSSLGELYIKKGEFIEAFKWLTKAEDQGDPNAQTWLGVMAENGLGIPQDDAKALEFYKKAADQGFAEAQVRVGLWYTKKKKLLRGNYMV